MTGRLKRTYELNELAKMGEPIDALVSLDELPRFVEALELEQLPGVMVECWVDSPKGNAKKTTLNGKIKTDVQVECQRCLKPMTFAIDSKFDWILTAQQKMADAHDDVQFVDRPIRLIEWLEDELLLCLPLFAKHSVAQCEATTIENYLATEEVREIETSRPFVGLKDLLTKN